MAGPNNGRYARPYNSPHVDEVEVRVPIGANGANSAPLSGYGVLSWTEVSQGTYDVANSVGSSSVRYRRRLTRTFAPDLNRRSRATSGGALPGPTKLTSTDGFASTWSASTR